MNAWDWITHRSGGVSHWWTPRLSLVHDVRARASGRRR